MIRPDTEAELAETIRSATAPFRIEGGGTRPVGEGGGGDVLSVAGLSGLTLYEPGALTVVVRAGTPLAEVEAALAEQGQQLAFEPMDHRGLLGRDGVPTIGGMVAANISGPRRIAVGACRDFLLGVRFVDGQGRIVKNGGRVMKNVTGYDLVKLICGSFGTLGVLSEVSLKVLPRPRASGMLICEGLEDVRAVRALSRALGAPYDVTGAAHVATGATLIRLEGFAESVRYRAGRLQRELAEFGDFAVEMDAEAVARVWADLRDVAPFHGRDGDVWRVSVKPSDAPAIVAGLADAEAIYDWGGGLIWLLVPEGQSGRAIRALVARCGGHATRVRGSGDIPAFQPQSAAVAALQDGVRHRFDPRGLFNPGLMGAVA